MSLVKTLEKLVSFKTVSYNHAENERALNWIEDQFKNLPVYIKRFKFKSFPSLVISTQKTSQLSARDGRAGQAKNPTMWLAAHNDVVPAPDSMFKTHLRGNKLYGRGVFDMKFATACYIELLKELKRDLKNYDFSVMITTDEEIGGQDGTKAVLEKGEYGGEVCILPDGSPNWEFRYNSKGIMRLKITSQGSTGHSSRPWLSVNAIENLAEFLKKTQKLFTPRRDQLDGNRYSTFTITKISGGHTENQVPDRAEAIVDIRTMPNVKKEHLRKKLMKYDKEFPGVEVQELRSAESFTQDKNHRYFKSFSSVAYDLFKIKTKFGITHGSSDANFFFDKGIFPILISPKGGGNHSNEEWIDVKDLERFYEVLKEFVKREARINFVQESK